MHTVVADHGVLHEHCELHDPLREIRKQGEVTWTWARSTFTRTV